MHKRILRSRLRPVARATSETTLLSVSSKIFEAIDSPRSLAAHILLREKEYAQLVSLEIDQNHYFDSQSFGDDYLATKLLSKFPDFSHEELDPEKAALDSFKEFEETCRTTNKKFSKLEEDPSLWDPEMRRIFLLARRKIASVLKTPDLDRISRSFGWGPGATTSTKGSHTSAYIKFKSRLDITSNALMMGKACVNSLPSWANCQLQIDEYPSVEVSLTYDAFNIVRGNEIVFVPKNAKTHRIIAKEPTVNSFLQKGFGAEIRRLLAAVGIDLKDQTLNQRLARYGSLTGFLATLDLRGASDTICRALVKFLLPKKWYYLLDQIRSQQGFLSKEKAWIDYQKFSSMGNGYTFELESLIFWALCKSCLEVNGQGQTLNVYGDDIIVPVEHYDNVVKVLNFAGFSVNSQKSFSTGNFRESCGKDYFLGTDVRPYFIKEKISNVESLFKLANGLRRYSHRRNFNYGCDKRFRDPWLHAVSFIPDDLRLHIPDGYGDGGLMVNFDEACPSRPSRGWEGFVFKAIIQHPVKQVMRDRTSAYAAVLSAAGVSSLRTSACQLGFQIPAGIDTMFGESTPLLGSHDLRAMTYPTIARIHTSSWYDLGPWE